MINGGELRKIAKRYHEVTDDEMVSAILQQCLRSAKRGEFETNVVVSELGPKTLDLLKTELNDKNLKFTLNLIAPSILIIHW